MLFATSSDFDVSLTTPDGVAIDEPKLTALGDGTPYRVAWIEAARPGEYALKVTNKGQGPLDVEFAIFGEVGLQLKVEWPKDADAILMGGVAKVNRVGLQREGFSSETIATINEAFKTLYRSKEPFSLAVERLKACDNCPEVEEILEFIANPSKCGIAGPSTALSPTRACRSA